ncbi:hypothetical protein HO173_003287 [Letharia columbiana]|uniref:Uncharacterized protein n=1 Tax=Letharia columbiana TaxID=112416 RepID=A0A8H6G1U3_9LECA|nr:uncharacterized protein HO173_003287 [Letharia columbiana]KAF6238780.1 hypothetical protein HO173_003287 [Letharia columbiana]
MSRSKKTPEEKRASAREATARSRAKGKAEYEARFPQANATILSQSSNAAGPPLSTVTAKQQEVAWTEDKQLIDTIEVLAHQES